MTDDRNLERDFLALIEDTGEPQHGCAVLAEYIELETKNRTVMAETLRELVIDPLDWYLMDCWKRNSSYRPEATEAFRLAADDIRYRFENSQLICIEAIEALEIKWVRFQAEVGTDNLGRWEKDLPYIRTGKKIKVSAALGHIAVHGTPEEKSARWEKYRRDCIDIARAHPRLGLTAIRQTVAEENGVSITTVTRHTRDLAKILRNA